MRIREVTTNEAIATVVELAFYEQLGFVLDRPLHTDIGDGFVMDDHRMVKHLTNLA